MIAEFMNFYPAYSLDKVLAMFAVTFYALLADMYKLKGTLNYQGAILTASATNGGEALDSYLEQAKKQADGISGLLRQARVLKKIKESK